MSKAEFPNHWQARWRISSLRLAALFGTLFVTSIVAMMVWIYGQASAFLERRVDTLIELNVQHLIQIPRADLLQAIAQAQANDLRHLELYGLFDREGQSLAGNLSKMPKLTSDGVLVQAERTIAARGVIIPLANGEQLVVGRDLGELAEIRQILLRAMALGGSVMLLLGLLLGAVLTNGQLRRVNNIRTIAQRITQGDLSQRLPVGPRRDEIDQLASTVNWMLDEIERLLAEVKGVTQNLAHDLRTPLTRLRLQLDRAQQRHQGTELALILDKGLEEIDTLLNRFKALLRISEINNDLRKAGFCSVDLAQCATQVFELYEPLVEDKGLRFDLLIEARPLVIADPDLILEVLSNLVDNAIKFTPFGGWICLRLSLNNQLDQACLELIDSGVGVGNPTPPGTKGHGLGLNLVNAIVHLHQYQFTLQATTPNGTLARLLAPTF
jgi:signal transduction histidine kinase